MKSCSSLLVFLLLSVLSFSQNEEFKIHSNGLMYSDTTMNQLEYIVDSLNNRFVACDLSKTYYSRLQAYAHFVKLDSGNVAQAKADMERGISFEDFLLKYPETSVEKELLVLKFNYRNYEDEEKIRFESHPQERLIYVDSTAENSANTVKGNWIYSYWEGNNGKSESVRAFYFTSNFEKQPLPEEYARMVQYSNCLIDTTSQKFTENAYRTGVRTRRTDTTKVSEFLDYVAQQTNKPEHDITINENYWNEYQKWDSLRFALIDQLSKQKEFQLRMKEAVNEALKDGGSDEEFEEYVERYHSKSAALELKRSRIVVGGCSADLSPRIHAMNIAILSAETVNWETFLRAHLDIMNDRFERVTDGSYAYASRNTYIKELEELEINVSDLLLGISLRIENPCENHYYGNISRLGRALAESELSTDVRNKMLEMIKSDQLDDFNRLVIYYLYLNFNYHIAEESAKADNIDKLKKAVGYLPDHLANRIEDFGE